MAAISVVRRRFRGYVHVSQFVVRRNRPPCAGVSSVFGRAVQPGLIARLAFAWNGMEDPHLLTCPDVERHDVAFYVLLIRTGATLRECGTNHNHIAGDN